VCVCVCVFVTSEVRNKTHLRSCASRTPTKSGVVGEEEGEKTHGASSTTRGITQENNKSQNTKRKY
jgi:hypothetical protein